MHPRWQQVLVPRLKNAFKNVQFVASTHSPLIVGGLRKEEVERFSIEHGRVQKIEFDPDMTLGRTDQILTGELFGLLTTLDLATQDLMTRYEELLGKSNPSEKEKEEMATLAATLEERIPPSPSTPIERRAGELLETLQRADMSAVEPGLRRQVEERAIQLSKVLRREVG